MIINSIPLLNHEGLLPPFLGDPTNDTGLSPYRTNFVDLVQSFGTSKRRLDILAGFARYRSRLFQVGLKKGVQWINGSFIQSLSREPGDIDVVTIFHSSLSRYNFKSVIMYNKTLFDRRSAKSSFDVDAYFVDAGALDYYQFSRRISYWFGLFSHTRKDFVWKGLLEIPLPVSPGECDSDLNYVILKQEA